MKRRRKSHTCAGLSVLGEFKMNRHQYILHRAMHFDTAARKQAKI